MNIKLEAKRFAQEVHKNQFRKVSNKPYIIHPIEVAQILEDAGFDDEVVAAGFLHDTVEDTSTTIDELTRIFGKRISSLVLFNTENKELSWEDRKTHTIETISTGLLEEKAIVVADKLSNLRQLKNDIILVGETEIWKAFKRPRSDQKWYFENVSNNAFLNLDKSEVPYFFYELQTNVFDFFK